MKNEVNAIRHLSLDVLSPMRLANYHDRIDNRVVMRDFTVAQSVDTTLNTVDATMYSSNDRLVKKPSKLREAQKQTNQTSA